ncbi:Sodium:neurotransmitter symporter [Trinorchestia longiramus]|nr:Sodium:neurotransmitter symporter [Trinorchestia longiramus]
MKQDAAKRSSLDYAGCENFSYKTTEGKFCSLGHNDLPPPYLIERSKLKVNEGFPSGSVEQSLVNLSYVKDSSPGSDDRKLTNCETVRKVTICHEKDEEEDEEERQQWSNPIEFLLSCIALSVGLGNVWRFPITAYRNGGGAFLIPYLVVLLFIGRPLYFLELSLGQFSSYGCIKLWKSVPAVKGVGYSQVVATSAILTYYVSLMAITVFYFCISFQSALPWSVCDPAWADMDSCVSIASNASLGFSSNAFKQSSAEQFFKRYVTHEAKSWEAGLGLPDWKLTLCLAASWLVLFLTLVKGVQSAGKTAYFTALFPYVVLFTLLGRGVTLPGAYDGIMYFLTPQWEKLLDGNVWYQAVTQSFFSLSVAFGSISMFSSYNDFKHNVYRDSLIISFMDTATSLLAGLTIFSVLGNLKYEIQADSIDDVVQGGAGLAFITYPTAIAKFNYVPQLFAVLFFLMLFTLGLGSATALTNCIVTVILDQWPGLNKAAVSGGVCFVGFLTGLIYITPEGLYILDLIDFFGGGTIVFFLAIFEAVAICYIYGLNKVIRDLKFMLEVDLGIYWKACWAVVVPFGLSGILAYSMSDFQLPRYNNQALPSAAYSWGYVLLVGALLVVPGGLCHALYNADCPPKTGLFEKLKFVLKPKPTWGPKKKKHRAAWQLSVQDNS